MLIAGVGILLGHGSWSAFTAGTGPVRLGSCATAMIPVNFSYSGWNAAAYLAEEIRDPQRNVPRALALGTVAVVTIASIAPCLSARLDDDAGHAIRMPTSAATLAARSVQKRTLFRAERFRCRATHAKGDSG